MVSGGARSLCWDRRRLTFVKGTHSFVFDYFIRTVDYTRVFASLAQDQSSFQHLNKVHERSYRSRVRESEELVELWFVPGLTSRG